MVGPIFPNERVETMAGIYAAEIYCSDCIDKIKDDIRDEGLTPDDPDDEGSYDSDEWPKYCNDSEESDSPSHCAECYVFLENDLSLEGYDYVADMIERDLCDGRFDSTAVTIWSDFYGLGVVVEIDARPDECEKLAGMMSAERLTYRVCKA